MTTIPLCDPADPRPRAPRTRLPPGTVDTHFHVFGPIEDYPLAPTRGYTPPDAPLAQYEELGRLLGFSRAVAVQPSVYGTDNRRILDAMRQSAMSMRGVAVIDADLPERELLRLHEQGIRGVRINPVFTAGTGFSIARPLADRVRTLGWHLQFLADVSKIADLARAVEALDIPVVFDHMGHVPAGKGVADKGFQALLGLVRDGRAWVKLSGAYRITAQRTPPPYGDAAPFAEALIAANPDRVLWASDWPHPSIPVPMPNDGDLVDMALGWAGEAEIRRKLFVTNAERLYGFEPILPAGSGHGDKNG
ncbi:MAG: amidohydrolase family protein [Mesorhizobium sp.]